MKAYPNIKLDFSLAPRTEETVYLHDDVSALDISTTGPFVRNPQGELVCVDGNTVFISQDEGKSWLEKPLFASPEAFDVQDTHSLCVTENGTLVLGFLNMAKLHFNWVKRTNKPTKNTFLHLWTVRSEDGGHTWQEPSLVQKGYCGATTTMISLSTGELVMAAQDLDYANGRHFSLSYVSDDDGRSWQASNHLDIGGQGHHGGCYEGTLMELQEGRVWYLIRTNLDWFWSAYSDNQGRTWTEIKQDMPASSSPGMLLRLQSGRLMLAYNQVYKQGENEVRRVAGQFSEVAASWQREELSVRFSDDDGQSWTDPVVVASCKGAWLSYNYLFEIEPGKIWWTTMQSRLKIELNENDFV